ncbi:hypothetical protein DQQ10_27495 [Pseudochryseolinea flava]|uniref:Uncharacterized protein n=2 Tax=Pseudochryseolinea flava TaxID=2059302 RepID=A0A364XUK2_9BACT|nr:hypothetical protein DQQ10_27495 [Pseudochryseolinea flava]
MENCIGLTFGLYESPNPEILARLGGQPFLNAQNNEKYLPLVDYFVMLGNEYISNYLSNWRGTNIDNWVRYIDQQIFAKSNEEYIGDYVCVFFSDERVRIMSYIEYEQNTEKYCELSLETFRQLTLEWKSFIIRWEIARINKTIV